MATDPRTSDAPASPVPASPVPTSPTAAAPIDAAEAPPTPQPGPGAPARPDPNPPRLVDRLHAYRHDPRVVAGALVLVGLVAALVWSRTAVPRGGPARATAAVARADRLAARAASTHDERVVVAQVAGAVTTPGLVRLRDGDRVADAIAAAGGARADADLDAVSLAARVADGERIVVPVRGVAPDPAGSTPGDADPGPSTGPVHLNTATAEELETLPGIGPSLAAAILRERRARGGFRSVQDLDAVRGIGEARFAELEPLVVL